ncbi:MAG: MopE-related protein, partial [Bradymonadia bacterium]
SRRCVDGVWENTCVPALALGADVSCDGRDQDCDGRLDEAFPIRTTLCGRGICRAEGNSSCAQGTITDSCEPNQAVGDDSLCNGIDEDCDGAVDEGYRGGMVQCGIGACESSGIAVCLNGSVESSCEPGAPRGNDQSCDGIDDDCDDRIDEGNVAQPTICGEGRCQRTGEARCEQGQRIDTCQPGEPQETDAMCNGVDDDCDGLVDEDFSQFMVTCGDGACTREAPARCEDGLLVSDCVEGEPREDDGTCDSIDDDCDGRVDEDFQVSPVTCGVGACERDGELTCDAGSPVEVCRPGIPSATDDVICDGVDADCDGIVDEDCPDRPTDSGLVSLDGGVSTDGDLSDTGSGLDLMQPPPVDFGTGFYCTDGGLCIDGAFESACDSGRDCGPSIADPRELYQPVESGCDCAQGQKVPFTWIGALVCALLGLPRRRFRG